MTPLWMGVSEGIRMRFISPQLSFPCTCPANSVDQTFLLESGLELIADFLRGLVGPTVDFAAAVRLSVYLDPASHNQAERVLTCGLFGVEARCAGKPMLWIS
jgi:hypothetical protein